MHPVPVHGAAQQRHERFGRKSTFLRFFCGKSFLTYINIIQKAIGNCTPFSLEPSVELYNCPYDKMEVGGQELKINGSYSEVPADRSFSHI